MIVGSVKRATVKVGPRFASTAPAGRVFTNLVEGQALGEFTVAQITPTHVTLSAAGGQQLVHFTKKSDRATGNTVAASITPAQPVQTASETPADSAQNANAAQPGVGESVPAAAIGNTVNAKNSVSAGAQPGVPGKEGAVIPAVVDIQNSLAAAIAAARANSANKPATNNSLNPFMQKP